jgi:hypothetical protein
VIKLKKILTEVTYQKSGLNKPDLADRNKDNKISSWEKKVAKNIEKNIEEDSSGDMTIVCPHCDWSWQYADGGKDPLTCHKCKEKVKIENYGDTTYNIGMKQYTTSKPKLSQNESKKIGGIDGTPCWRGYRYAGTENGKDKCVPINENIMCNECGGMMYEDMCMECGYDQLDSYESQESGMDHEVGMAQNLLQDIIRNAEELMQKIGEEEINLPGWIQDHISQAQNYIDQANVGYHEL